MPWTYISSFMEAPKIKSLIFYYFSPIHNLGSYVSVIISVCYKNKTCRFQNSLAYPPVFLTDFANWAKSARSTSPPLWKVLSSYPCLWPTSIIYLCTPLPVCKESRVRLVNLFSIYPIGKWMSFRKFALQKNCNQSCSLMTLGLVHASCSLHEWEAVKLTFFAPCLLLELVNDIMSWCMNALKLLFLSLDESLGVTIKW